MTSEERGGLRAWLSWLEDRIAHLVASARLHDPDPASLFRGAFIDDDHAEFLLVQQETVSSPPPPAATGTLAVTASRFDLDEKDISVLVAAMAPDFEQRFEQLYGYLNDDLAQRRLSFGLAMRIASLDPMSPGDRSRVLDQGRLVSAGLVVAGDRDRPFPTRSLRVPDNVAMALLETATERSVTRAADGSLAAHLVDNRAFVQMAGPLEPALDELDEAAALLGLPVDTVDSDSTTLHTTLAASAIRENVVAVIARHDMPSAVAQVLSSARTRVAILGSGMWDPASAPRTPVPLALTRGPQSTGRSSIRSADVADRSAAAYDRLPNEDDQASGSRSQDAPQLARLARRVIPKAGLEDLILPDSTLAVVRQIVERVNSLGRMAGHPLLGERGDSGTGTTVMFAGPSGTGKTMAAEVLAKELGVDLYIVDLATVIDKYIGETEKNLDAVFEAAERVSGVLFFDEADAIFGKRSEVSDARDRYANLEVAYLLQRMERFAGVAVLATNLRSNLDPAFTRRIAAIAEFPKPDLETRRGLWRSMLVDIDLDSALLDKLADFELTGGQIRAAIVDAAAARVPPPPEVLLATATDQLRKSGDISIQ